MILVCNNYIIQRFQLKLLFSFQTNKVVIFKNQILMDQQQFRATIYGFDEHHSFSAKLTIYGIKL